MKRLVLSLTLAAASITGLGGVSAANDLPHSQASGVCRPDGSTCHHDYTYHVEYYDCSCGEWHCYGVYDTKCQATAAAKKLAAKGYKIRIELEFA